MFSILRRPRDEVRNFHLKELSGVVINLLYYEGSFGGPLLYQLYGQTTLYIHRFGKEKGSPMMIRMSIRTSE